MSNDDPADAGDPHGAPKPVPVPPDVIDEANRTFDANEVLAAIQEIRGGGGLKFEDSLTKLEKLQ